MVSIVNSKSKKPVIIFDVDAVLLDWMSRLSLFLTEKCLPFDHVNYDVRNPGAGMVPPEAIFLAESKQESLALMQDYNSSDHMKQLPIFEQGAAHTLSLLSTKFDLFAVTNMGTEDKCYLNRHANLELRYPGSIAKLFCLDFAESKYETLSEIKASREVVAFIDDTGYKVKDGLRAGINSYQFAHENGSVDDTLPRIYSLKALLPLLDGESVEAEMPAGVKVANA